MIIQAQIEQILGSLLARELNNFGKSSDDIDMYKNKIMKLADTYGADIYNIGTVLSKEKFGFDNIDDGICISMMMAFSIIVKYIEAMECNNSTEHNNLDMMFR